MVLLQYSRSEHGCSAVLTAAESREQRVELL